MVLFGKKTRKFGKDFLTGFGNTSVYLGGAMVGLAPLVIAGGVATGQPEIVAGGMAMEIAGGIDVALGETALGVRDGDLDEVKGGIMKGFGEVGKANNMFN